MTDKRNRKNMKSATPCSWGHSEFHNSSEINPVLRKDFPNKPVGCWQVTFEATKDIAI